MSEQSIYKDVLLDHYRKPRNRGDLSDAEVVKRGSNPRCGDDIEVGVNFADEVLDKVAFRGRGCSVCLASASMMTETVNGKSVAAAEQLYSQMRDWFDPAVEGDKTAPAESLQALEAVREHPARRKCVLLSWQALHDAINERQGVANG
jgi:nitrogen fixation NifU-like protein